MELPNSLCWTFHYHQAHYNSVAWYYQQMNMVEQLGKASWKRFDFKRRKELQWV